MAVFDLTFSLRQGHFVLEMDEHADVRALALFGPSGSGKTTAIEAIAGLRQPDRGTIAVSGHLLFSHDRRVNVPPRLRRVGYVPQDVLLFPHLDVRGNVLYGRRDGARADLGHLIELLELGTIMNRRVPSLSGGERQRVALARALMSAPDVLLLDEPMAAVDLPRRRRILDALLRIRDELTVPLVYVAHSPEEVSTIADRVVVLDGGTVVESGPPKSVLDH
jgi:molybdate transport system ATP-binding protein